MAAITPDATIGNVVALNRNGRDVKEVKIALIKTAASAAQGDTYTFDLATLGGTTLLGVYSLVHTTINSVMVLNAVTTAVVGTTITFTIPAAGGTVARASKIYFK